MSAYKYIYIYIYIYMQLGMVFYKNEVVWSQILL